MAATLPIPGRAAELKPDPPPGLGEGVGEGVGEGKGDRDGEGDDSAGSDCGVPSSTPVQLLPTHWQVIRPDEDHIQAVPARQYCPFEQQDASAGMQFTVPQQTELTQ
ncbi:hypothetical protein LTR84_000395 [Exophiala bonariae]|uniref:Uncharacterized protein n=1 Tax=Exophiala bonariae TaxID=1690606 RepID=A0AAV9NT84_9EURO|nr:hypothetical protein LTR84_000395 [Exophiala bonariae]